MLQGLEIVIAMFCITLIVSIPLGIGVAFLRLSNNKLVSGITQCYILIMRYTFTFANDSHILRITSFRNCI